MNYWIEKTLVKGRQDRESGDRALGKALWSPQLDKRGADIYKNMRKIAKGDIVLHLIDNSRIIGISIVSESAKKSNGLSGTNWDGPTYLIELHGFIELNPSIKRHDFLNQEFSSKLKEISSHSEVFYNRKLDLRQGAYITPCNEELLTIINDVYKRITNNNLPYMENVDLKNIIYKIEPTIPFDLKNILLDLELAGLIYSKALVTRFIASLLTKPFVILTGLSGSGKTKLAQAFALWICENKEQYCIVPVGADWTNREPLLGFPNALKDEEYIKPDNEVLDTIINASKYPEKPYFLILDEMNLSHVERYFADFLSTMESGDEISLHSGKQDWSGIPAKLKIPKNLFIIGTVNVDETTYMFSPKVLDRANTIEFSVSAEEMSGYLSQQIPLDLANIESQGKSMAEDFINIANNKALTISNDADIQKELMKFFNTLKAVSAEFGYRTAAEIIRFVAVINKVEPSWINEQIIDAAIMQKLLPKVHGSRRKLEPVLKTLGQLCMREEENVESFLSSSIDSDHPNIKYPISFRKIRRMYHGLIDNGFTSYAEA